MDNTPTPSHLEIGYFLLPHLFLLFRYEFLLLVIDGSVVSLLIWLFQLRTVCFLLSNWVSDKSCFCPIVIFRVFFVYCIPSCLYLPRPICRQLSGFTLCQVCWFSENLLSITIVVLLYLDSVLLYGLGFLSSFDLPSSLEFVRVYSILNLSDYLFFMLCYWSVFR